METKAKKFCEALARVAHLSPDESRKVVADHAPTKRKDKEARKIYFEFDDGSHAYFSEKEGVISLPGQFA